MKLKLFVLNLYLYLFFGSILASGVDAFVTINRFYQIETEEAYIEISYLVPFNTVKYAKTENIRYQAKLKTSMFLRQNDSVVNLKQYILQTPEYVSEDNIRENLTDLIRLSAPAGDTLILEILIEDLNDTTFFKKELPIYIPAEKEAFLSDIMLVSSTEEANVENAFTRNGLDVIPKFLNFYPTEINNVKFYCEFYQAKTSTDYLINYLITNEEGFYIDGFAGYKKINNKQYEVLISGFDISKLASGNYYLFVELKNSNNKIIERKRAFFQRSNKSNEADEKFVARKNELEVIVNNFARKYDLKNIQHHLQALDPIADPFEKATIKSFKESENAIQMQNYFFSFWKQRNEKDPELEWKAYAEKLKYVESRFTTIDQRGFETARGRVYLRYGEPFRQNLNRRKKIGEYWIWNYERIDDQSNVYFVFLNQSNVTDEFTLVHTSLRGEIFDKQWAEYLKNEL